MTVSKRVLEIDIARGIAIILVVAGHLVAIRTTGPFWYAELKTFIYNFHMPLFMVLSGFSFFHSAPFRRTISLSEFIRSRATRLLLPFVAFGLIVIFGKYFASLMGSVENAPRDLLVSVQNLMLHTRESDAISVWYIFALFVYLVVCFVAIRMMKIKVEYILAISAIMYLVEFPDVLYADRIGKYFLYFCLGMALSKHYSVARDVIFLHGKLITALFLIISATSFIFYNENEYISMFLISSFAIPSVLYFSIITGGNVSRLLIFIGSYSMTIYLFNTIIIGCVKYLISSASSGEIDYGLFLPLSFVAALFVPILIFHVINRVHPPTAKFLR